MSVSICEAKGGEICKESIAAVLDTSFFGGESYQVCLQNRSLGATITPAIRLVHEDFAFPPCS